MSTRSFTDTEKREWLMLFDHYDWSAAAFCREYMLPYGSFLNWRRERESLSVPADIDGGDAETRFVELVPQSAQSQCRELSAPTMVMKGDAWAAGCLQQQIGHCSSTLSTGRATAAAGEVLAELELGSGYMLRVYRQSAISPSTSTATATSTATSAGARI